jgi:hypothetical protein
LKLARANSSYDPTSKKNKQQQQQNHNKRAAGVVQGVGPEFKPQYLKKKKKNLCNRQEGYQFSPISKMAWRLVWLKAESCKNDDDL